MFREGFWSGVLLAFVATSASADAVRFQKCLQQIQSQGPQLNSPAPVGAQEWLPPSPTNREALVQDVSRGFLSAVFLPGDERFDGILGAAVGSANTPWALQPEELTAAYSQANALLASLDSVHANQKELVLLVGPDPEIQENISTWLNQSGLVVPVRCLTFPSQPIVAPLIGNLSSVRLWQDLALSEHDWIWRNAETVWLAGRSLAGSVGEVAMRIASQTDRSRTLVFSLEFTQDLLGTRIKTALVPQNGGINLNSLAFQEMFHLCSAIAAHFDLPEISIDDVSRFIRDGWTLNVNGKTLRFEWK